MGRFLEMLMRALGVAFALPFALGGWLIKEMREHGQRVPPPPDAQPAAEAQPAVSQAREARRGLGAANFCGKFARATLDGQRPSMAGAKPHLAAWLRRLTDDEMEILAVADAEDIKAHLCGLSPHPGLQPVDGYPPRDAAPAPSVVVPFPSRRLRGGGMLAEQKDDEPVYRMAV